MQFFTRKVFSLCVVLFLWLVGTVWAASAPPFEMETSRGKVSLEDLRGKVVYLDFWATWCEPCRKSFPWMKTMQEKYGDQGFVVLAMNLDKERENVEKFLQKFQANFTIGFDPEGKIARVYQVKGMPSSFLIDRHGNIHSSHLGFRKKELAELESTIKALLTADSPSQ